MCGMHYRRWWRSNNKQRNYEYNKRYYEDNIKDKIKWKPQKTKCKNCSAYYIPTGKNQKYCSKTCQNNFHCKKKRYTNINYKLRHNLRSRLRKALNGRSRDKTIIELLGCEVEQFKKYIESMFKPGMSWDNYGQWHLDHIRPLANFDLTKTSELEIACNYKNIQPMWAIDNLVKGSS